MISSKNNPSPRHQVANQIINTIKKKASCQVISFPGNGAGYLIEKLLSDHKIDFRFIDPYADTIQILTTVNIFRINKPNFLFDFTKLDQYFHLANSKQKFIVINELPFCLSNQSYISSYFIKHIYQHFYLPTNDPTDTKHILQNLNPDLIPQTDTIQLLTGGISRLIKTVSNHPLLLTANQTDQINQLIKPIYDVISPCSPQQLQKLNLTNSQNNYLSTWISQYQKNHSKKFPIIQINNDLTIVENNQPNKNEFTKTEIDILTFLLTNPFINRDQIADIKWGHLADEKYSDEAINKTISRLNSKLNFYLIQSIPKLGYKLIPN